MRKKITMLLMSLLAFVGVAEAQVYQKVPHIEWTVTAPNQSATNSNEGGVAFIKDENAATFYHSDWGDIQYGKQGLQGFMVDMGKVVNGITKITYTGRSDGRTSGWAKKVRIYLYESLPEGVPADLSTLSHDEKEALFAKTSTALGTAAFDNNESGEWASNTSLKTAEFTEVKSARYVLFIQDVGVDSWLTCADFHVWQKIDGIVEDQPYYLKMTNIAKDGNEGDWYLDTNTPVDDSQDKKTIGKSATPVATYFTLNDGYWHISTMPGHESDFISVNAWCATPQSAAPANWTMEKNDDGSFYLIQNVHGTGSNRYLGGSDIINGSGNKNKVYTDQTQSNAVKFVFVALNEEQTEAEEARVAAEKINTAKENARAVLSKTGVGYPAIDSEARTTLQNAIDAAEATVESINAAITTYQSAEQTVLKPEAGKVYRLVSAYTNFTSKKAVYSDNNELKWMDLNETAMNQLWVVQNISGNNITLMNLNDAMYPQTSGFTNAVKMLAVKNEGSITFVGKGQFRVCANKQQSMHTNGNNNGTGASGIISNTNTDVDGAAVWYFEEVAVTQEILAKQIEALSTTYLGSLLIKQESVVGLQTAVEAAKQVCDASEGGNYAEALANLTAAVNDAAIEYIDLGYFYMKAKGSGKYAYNDGTDLKTQQGKSPKSIFRLTKANNGTFYIQNGNGFYAQDVSTSEQTTIAAGKIEYTISRLASDYYVLRPTSSSTSRGFWHQDGWSKVVGWSTDEDNTQWTFETLTVEETDKIYTVADLNSISTNVYVTINDESYTGDKEVKQAGGFYVLDEAPEVSDFTVKNVDTGLINEVRIVGNTLYVNEGYNNTGNLYILRCKKDNSYARYHNGSQLSQNDNTNMLTYEGNVYTESLFYVEQGTGDYNGYYTIRSFAAPTLYAYNLGTADDNSKVAMKEAPEGGVLTSDYYWKISSLGENAGNITPYATGGNSGDAYGWNKRGSYNGYNHIGYWKGHNTENDNLWFVRFVEEEFELPLHTLDNSVIGYATYESVAPLQACLDIITSTGLNKLKNAQYDVVYPETGKFYRFKHPTADAYMLSDVYSGNNKRLAMGALESNGISSIFYYGEEGTLLSYAIGQYLSEADDAINKNWTCKPIGSTAPTVTFGKGSDWGRIGFYLGDKSDRAYYSARETYVDAGGSIGGVGYDWIVEEVTTLPVAVTAAGYATLYAPVALEIPEVEGLKVYTATVGDTYVRLTEIEGGVIPAETGVIIEAPAETYDFVITEETADVTSDFVGSFAKSVKNADAKVYTLQMPNKEDENSVGFYLFNGQNSEGATTYINGFRAWVELDIASQVQSLRITRGEEGDDNTTGIESVEADEELVIYDLAGRRVQKMEKGIYIVNGRKVVVK